MDIFEYATRKAVRFTPGQMTVEDVWSLPVSAKRGLTLDDVYSNLKEEEDGLEKHSLLSSSDNPKKEELTVKLDIVKHIFAVKSSELEAEKNEAEKKRQRNRINELIADKQDQAMSEKSVEELVALRDSL